MDKHELHHMDRLSSAAKNVCGPFTRIHIGDGTYFLITADYSMEFTSLTGIEEYLGITLN